MVGVWGGEKMSKIPDSVYDLTQMQQASLWEQAKGALRAWSRYAAYWDGRSSNDENYFHWQQEVVENFIKFIELGETDDFVLRKPDEEIKPK
jgi:hypothetical protein